MVRSVLGALLLFSFGLIIFEWVGVVWLALVAGGTALYGATSKVGVREAFARLDGLVFSGERLVVAASLLVMALVVFIDVVWRTAHSVDTRSAWTFSLGILALCLVGGFTARWEKGTALKRAAAGLAAFAVMAVACALIYSAPNGFGWSQRLALVLILWVSLLGGSMATKEGRHIAVDAVKRLVPEKLKRGFEVAAGLVTVGLSTVLAILGVMYVRGNWEDWVVSDYRSFVFESLPIPYWAATLPIPIGFGLMAARFLAMTLYGAKEVDLLTSVGAGQEADGDAG